MPHSTVSQIDHTWLRNTLLGFENTELSIKHTLPQLPNWKTDDIFIMDKILKTMNITNSQMEILNAVRMHLQVSTLSNITTADGRSFNLFYLGRAYETQLTKIHMARHCNSLKAHHQPYGGYVLTANQRKTDKTQGWAISSVGRGHDQYSVGQGLKSFVVPSLIVC